MSEAAASRQICSLLGLQDCDQPWPLSSVLSESQWTGPASICVLPPSVRPGPAFMSRADLTARFAREGLALLLREINVASGGGFVLLHLTHPCILPQTQDSTEQRTGSDCACCLTSTYPDKSRCPSAKVTRKAIALHWLRLEIKHWKKDFLRGGLRVKFYLQKTKYLIHNVMGICKFTLHVQIAFC
ncbi:hypothetical protein NDU88_006856 [Pleurodeles waltl]|uniref:Uncharacterized protein n=1 Tax=Pleurodeles waltl TaxID=8319 RepID=A0AAV7QK91_PLEWA|nr:hypothetical protein NDU88_006856 [Pleurodeles waltl]